MKTKLIVWMLAFSGIVNGQYKVLLNFNDTNGAGPYGSLSIVGNKLYGMTNQGGAYNDGCIFSIDTDGSRYKDMLDFNGSNGLTPFGSLTSSGSILYGMTYEGGSDNYGTIFSIDTSGSKYKILLNFNDTNGARPNGSLALMGNKLYGTTSDGGVTYQGNIFSIDTNGNEYKSLFSFNYSSGYFPDPYLLISSAGVLYGMTIIGGANNLGTVFSIDTNGGKYKDILDFNDKKGLRPVGSLTLLGGMLYGVTMNGGKYDSGCIFSIDTNGSKYKILLNFNGANGLTPDASLTPSGSKLYGTTGGSGINYGNIFSIDTDGSKYNTLFNFNYTNGLEPFGSLILSGNILYGTTNRGGSNGDGVIFKIDTSAPVTTSINNLKAIDVAISVYPNPSNGQFTFNFNTPVSGTIEIYNVLGEQVLTGTLRSAQPARTGTGGGNNLINLSNQPNGVYFYRVITQTGDLVGEGKIIVQK